MESLSQNSPESNPTKRCPKCQQILPSTKEFWCADKNSKDGLDGRCKSCRTVQRREYNQREAVKARKQQWQAAYERPLESKLHQYQKRQTPEHKAWKSAYDAQYRKRPDVMKRTEEWYRHYSARPEVKAHRSAYAVRHYQLPEIQARQRAYRDAYKQRPEVQMRMQAYEQSPERKFRRSLREQNPARKLQKSINGHRRRARRLSAPGAYTPQQLQEQYHRQKKKCYYCQRRVQWGKHHADHVIPLSRGGSNDISNIVITCPSCNLKKNRRLPHEWPEGGRLL